MPIASPVLVRRLELLCPTTQNNILNSKVREKDTRLMITPDRKARGLPQSPVILAPPDLDECAHNNGGCEGECHNHNGTGHTCSCGDNQILKDGYRCEDCKLNFNSLSHSITHSLITRTVSSMLFSNSLSLNHSLTHPLTHSLTPTLTHLPTCSLTPSLHSLFLPLSTQTMVLYVRIRAAMVPTAPP